MRQHVVSVLFVVAAILLWPHVSSAHCDGMDGPVVIAAQKALDSGNVSLVLIWVQKTDEAYVSFVHYVERLYEASKTSAHGQFAEVHGAAAHAD